MKEGGKKLRQNVGPFGFWCLALIDGEAMWRKIDELDNPQKSSLPVRKLVKVKSFEQDDYEFGVAQHETNRQSWNTPKNVRYPLKSLLPENYNPALTKMLIEDAGIFGTILLKIFAEPFDFFKQVAENWNK